MNIELLQGGCGLFGRNDTLLPVDLIQSQGRGQLDFPSLMGLKLGDEGLLLVVHLNAEPGTGDSSD